MKKHLFNSFVPWLVVISAWSIVAYAGVYSSYIIPYPHKVAREFFAIVSGKNLGDGIMGPSYIWPNIGATLRRVLVAFFLGTGLGIPLGMAVGSFRKIRWLIEPPTSFLRAIPVTSLFPVFMVILGIFEGPKIAMTAVSVGLVMMVGAMEGVLNAEKEIVEAARLDGANDLQLIRSVTSYLALPHIYASVRVALPHALVLVIVSEMFIGARAGLGYVISQSSLKHNMPEVWAELIILGLIGMGINKALEAIRPVIASLS